MYLSEIFYSIQGEGELTGVPSVFIRTSGCNLRCRWCDTKYASWEPQGSEYEVTEIIQKVQQYPARHCVITGGEPMVAKGIHDLTEALHTLGYHITIETAATVSPGKITCDLASLSPKLASSTPLESEIESGWISKHEALRIQPDIIREWIDRHSFQCKFVVSGEADVEEIQELLTSLDRDIPAHKILLMPEGISTEQLRERNKTLVELCKEHGYRYSNRLHIELFGNTPGT